MRSIIDVLLLVLIFACLSFYVSIPYIISEEVYVTVTGKERVVSSNSSKYLVFTEEEVFENTDIIVRFKFNSSDIYGRLQEGESYKLLVCGWRIPILSRYRNIIKIKD